MYLPPRTPEHTNVADTTIHMAADAIRQRRKRPLLTNPTPKGPTS